MTVSTWYFSATIWPTVTGSKTTEREYPTGPPAARFLVPPSHPRVFGPGRGAPCLLKRRLAAHDRGLRALDVAVLRPRSRAPSRRALPPSVRAASSVCTTAPVSATSSTRQFGELQAPSAASDHCV